MKKLTQEELAEDDVIVIITDRANLPKEVYEILRLYIGHRNATSTTYKLPAYQARELNELSRLHQQAISKGTTP